MKKRDLSRARRKGGYASFRSVPDPEWRYRGHVGGVRSAGNMTQEQRTARARKAANARWNAKRQREGIAAPAKPELDDDPIV